jgi:hypothetical protein
MSTSSTMNPPELPGILPFRCPPDRWIAPTQLDVPARPGAFVMAPTTLGTIRPGSGEYRKVPLAFVGIELAQGVL